MRKFLFCLFSFITIQQLQAQEMDAHIAAEQKRFSALKEYDLQSLSSNNFDVHYYRCEWTIDPAVRFISGSVTSYFTIVSGTNNITFDLSSVMTVDSVFFRGNKIPFSQPVSNALQINFPVSLAAGVKDSVSIFYKGVPPNTGAFTQNTHNNVKVIYTLSEPYGARTWWPCKDMLKDKADSIDIIITNPSTFTSSSNGVPVQDIVVGAQRTVHWKHRYPIVAYLVALAITNYNVTSDVANLPSRTMPVVAYAYPESVAAFTPATATAKFCLEEFSKYITEYPFVKERYAQTQWNIGGGMEHQTNSFIGSAAPSLVAHELGHQWFGDKVTCGSWSDLWLNEGFATYMEYLYTELSNPANRLLTLQSWKNTITSQNNGSVYILDTLNESRLFSNRLTYKKGGYLVHMLRWKLGDSTFFRGVRRYLNDPQVAYGTALSGDLKRNLEQESGQNLTEFFNDWLYGEGHPDYNATWSQKPNLEVQVKLNQAPSHPSVAFFEMPVPLRFLSGTKDTIIRVEHTQNGQIFTFNLDFIADTMFIDPQLWILSKNKTTQKVAAIVGIPPVQSPGFQVAPNPAISQLHITMPGNLSTNVTIELSNAAGQSVYRRIVRGTTKNYTVPTNNIAGGIYWLSIRDEKEIKLVRKILVTRP